MISAKDRIFLPLSLAACGAMVVAGFLLFGSAGRDDAHITYWPAYTLANFGQILNYNGDRVEQSSSLLQVLLLGVAAKWTDLNIVTLGRLSSIGAGILTLVLAFRLAARTAGAAAGFAVVLLTASSPAFVYWSFGGLESTLVAATALMTIDGIAGYAEDRRPARLAYALLASALFAVVRPETPLILIGMLSVSSLLVGATGLRQQRRALGIALGGALAIFALVLAFRWLYFGRLFPQPVTAKTAGLSLEALKLGSRYLWETATAWDFSTGSLSAIALVGLGSAFLHNLKSRWADTRTLLGLLFVAGYAAFVAAAGGDWMEGGRFVVPILPVLMLFVGLALSRVFPRPRSAVLVLAICVALGTRSTLALAKNASTGIPWGHRSPMQDNATYDPADFSWFEIHNRANLRDTALITQMDAIVSDLLRTRQTVVILSTQMGIVPYHIVQEHFRQVHFIDRVGLSDRAVTDCALTRDSPRTASGLLVDYDYYLGHLSELERACGIPPPDVVYDILSDREALAEKHGYRIVYSQRGHVTQDSRFPGGYISAEVFIAVRPDLLVNLDARYSSGRVRTVF